MRLLMRCAEDAVSRKFCMDCDPWIELLTELINCRSRPRDFTLSSRYCFFLDYCMRQMNSFILIISMFFTQQKEGLGESALSEPIDKLSLVGLRGRGEGCQCFSRAQYLILLMQSAQTCLSRRAASLAVSLASPCLLTSAVNLERSSSAIGFIPLRQIIAVTATREPVRFHI